MNEIRYKPIGIIHSPYKEPKGTPIQPTAALNIPGVIEVFPEFGQGLRDLDGFSHAVLVYHFHLSKAFYLKILPVVKALLKLTQNCMHSFQPMV